MSEIASAVAKSTKVRQSQPKQALMDQLQRELVEAVDELPLATKPEDIVHGEGDLNSAVMLIGEAPGFHEQQQRRPFVGRSGKLLRQVLSSVEFPPPEVWISNIVKARPPENRDPLPEEIVAYRPYLDEEIAIISPKLIITLGRFSMSKFLDDVRISQVHGRLHRLVWADQTIYVLPMYHPAAALRSTKVKLSLENDFRKIAPALDWINQQRAADEQQSKVTEALF